MSVYMSDAHLFLFFCDFIFLFLFFFIFFFLGGGGMKEAAHIWGRMSSS